MLAPAAVGWVEAFALRTGLAVNAMNRPDDKGSESEAKLPRRRGMLSPSEYVAGVLAGDRGLLARAVTLIESTSPLHEAQAQEVIQRLLPHTGGSRRIGITGVPGVGKSTFIERFGCYL